MKMKLKPGRVLVWAYDHDCRLEVEIAEVVDNNDETYVKTVAKSGKTYWNTLNEWESRYRLEAYLPGNPGTEKASKNRPWDIFKD